MAENIQEGSGDVSEKLEEVMVSGGKVYISGEHALAAGFPRERAIAGAKFVEDAYDEMIDLVMEEWDKVIIC